MAVSAENEHKMDENLKALSNINTTPECYKEWGSVQEERQYPRGLTCLCGRKGLQNAWAFCNRENGNLIYLGSTCKGYLNSEISKSSGKKNRLIDSIFDYAKGEFENITNLADYVQRVKDVMLQNWRQDFDRNYNNTEQLKEFKENLDSLIQLLELRGKPVKEFKQLSNEIADRLVAIQVELEAQKRAEAKQVESERQEAERIRVERQKEIERQKLLQLEQYEQDQFKRKKHREKTDEEIQMEKERKEQYDRQQMILIRAGLVRRSVD